MKWQKYIIEATGISHRSTVKMSCCSDDAHGVVLK